MKIKIQNQPFEFISDNSSQIDDKTAFIASKLSKQYIDDAMSKNTPKIINSKELKNYFDLDGIKVIGITGTNGKTTTAGAIYSILLDLGYKVALQGTRGFYINDEKIEDYTLTTPTQLVNLSRINRAKELGCEYFIMEVSSHAISQERIEGIDFELKVISNITQDHIDYHNSIDEYRKIKNSFLADKSKKLTNKDDKNIKANITNAMSYGLDSPSTFKVQAYTFKDDIMSVAIEHFGELESFNSSMLGVFNVYNLASAVASVKMTTDKSLAEICEVVENFAGVLGRMQIIHHKPLVIVDFAHTPDGMSQVLNSFKNRDKIVVFGAGGDRDKSKRPIMGKIAENEAQKVFVTSDNPRFEDPDEIINDILKGIKDTQKIAVELNRKKAIFDALKVAKEDDVVLILGKGDEEHQIIYDKKLPLNDVKVVEEYYSTITKS
jgi:UDP-N-acetylmuramoyl-L-alanyl-D-glutamate--2,6-diaminopimelate ligase